jgi:hypothetical protein
MCLIHSNDNNKPVNNEFNPLIIDNGFEYHLKWIVIIHVIVINGLFMINGLLVQYSPMIVNPFITVFNPMITI